MELSKKTLAELRAGAERVAENEGRQLDPNWLTKATSLAERRLVLYRWEHQKRITIERVFYTPGPVGYTTYKPRTDKREEVRVVHIVRVGNLDFRDEAAEINGTWPSELLIAEVMLALDAGQDRTSDDAEY